VPITCVRRICSHGHVSLSDHPLPQLGIATQAHYRSQIANHLVPAFGEQKLCEIDRLAVEQFLTAKSEVLGWWARNNLCSILSAIFRVAKDWRLWDGANPVIGVRIGKKRFVREKRLLTVATANPARSAS
jgi:hypothetical protein